MRSLLQALASLGLSSAPFGFVVVVLAGMTAPASLPAAQQAPERTVLLQLDPVEDEPVAPEPTAAPVEGPSPAVEVPKPTEPVPNFIGTAPKIRETPPTSSVEPPDDGEEGPAGRKRSCLPPDSRIVDDGEGHWTVSRELVEAYASPSKVEELAWANWRTDASGQVEGFVVKRMRCGALLRQAGMRNGDVVLAVNGHAITSYWGGFTTWRKLRGEDRFRVKVRGRDGQVRVLRYTLI